MAYNIPQNDEDFLQMQQEAIRRVREMQQRARRTLEDAGMPIEPEQQPDAPETVSPAAMHATVDDGPPHTSVSGHAPVLPLRDEAAANKQATQPQRQDKPPVSMKPSPMFDLSLDSEQIMLLVVAFLLYQDHADRWILLAIVYILI